MESRRGVPSTFASLLRYGLFVPHGHTWSCVRTAAMVRCPHRCAPESPLNRHDVALTPYWREARPPPTGDAVAQPMNRGRTMMISQPAMMCLNATWQRLTGRSTPSAVSTTQQPLASSGAVEVIEGEVDVASESLVVATSANEGKDL